MKRVSRTLLAVAACAITSLALATTSAVAAPSSTGATGPAGPHAKPLTLPKIKGAKVYYYCGTLVEEFEGCPSQFPFVVRSKAKTWEFYGDPGYGGYIVKYKKNKFTYFYYDEGFNEECVLVGLKVKGGYTEGGFYCDFGEGYELEELWEAYKV